MATLTITLADDDLRLLQDRAAELETTPENLVRLRIEDLLTGRESNFEHIAAYVLSKNAELYRRLA